MQKISAKESLVRERRRPRREAEQAVLEVLLVLEALPVEGPCPLS